VAIAVIDPAARALIDAASSTRILDFAGDFPDFKAPTARESSKTIGDLEDRWKTIVESTAQTGQSPSGLAIPPEAAKGIRIYSRYFDLKPCKMNPVLKAPLSRQGGAALIISPRIRGATDGLGVAYLSRTTSDRQVAHSSFNQANVDQLAQSAMDNVIAISARRSSMARVLVPPPLSAQMELRTISMCRPPSQTSLPMRSPHARTWYNTGYCEPYSTQHQH